MRRNSTAKVDPKNKSRGAEFSLCGDDDSRDSKAALIETLMNDPVKRAMVMQLINSQKEAIEEYRREERMHAGCPSPAEKLKRKYVLENPLTLLRRRALRKRERLEPESSGSKPITSSPTPMLAFDKLLEKIVAFVDVKSGDKDRSEGVKALLKNMGATVVHEFTKDVTHVIFKDGSFLTYQRAKLMKKHLVSVLWLETIRTTGRRVPESNYPALGMSSYDNNITLICEKLQNEYIDVVKDEMCETLTSTDALSQRKLSSQQNKMALLSQLGNFKNSTFSEDLIPNSPHQEVRSFTSGSNILRVKTPESFVIDESDADSDCGVINGHSHNISIILSDDSEKPCSSSASSKPSEYDETIIKRLNLDVDMEITPNISRISRVNNTVGNSSKEADRSTRKNKTMEDVGTLVPTSMESNPIPDKHNKIINRWKTKLKINESLISSIRLNITGNEDEVESSENIISSSRELNITGTEYKAESSENVITSSVESKSKDLPRNNESTIKDYIKLFNGTDEDRKTTKKTHSSLFNPVEAHNNVELFTEENEKGKLKTVKILQSVQKADASSSTKTSEGSLDIMSKTREEASLDNKNTSTEGNRGSVSTDIIISTSLESNGGKRKESLESVGTNVSEELGVFVTRRKPWKPRVSLDKDGFKIPDKSINSSILTDDGTSIVDSSTEKVAQASKLSMTSTEGQLSSLRMSDQSGSKKSTTSVDMSPLILSTTGSTSSNSKTSFSSLEKINNSNSISKLITHLESSNTSNEFPNVSAKAVRGRRKKNLQKENIGKSTLIKVKGNNVLDESKKIPDVYSSIPEKQIPSSIQGKKNLITKGEATSTKKRWRKLYNPNDICSDRLGQEIIEEAKNDELAQKAIKKPSSLPKVPILLTERSKKLMENKLRSVSSSSSEDDEEVIGEILKYIERTPTVKKNKKEKVHVDPNLDEQKDLMKELVGRKVGAKQPKSQRKRDDLLPIKPLLNRRSTMDFMPKETPTPKKKNFKRKPSSIVCTRFHRKEMQAFQQIVKALGYFVVEMDVTDRTTHLVVAEPNRTINILRAIARGIWVLRSEWLYSSSKNGKWLPEEDYELINFSPAVQQCRIERQTFRSKYSMDVFINCGPMYVARSTNPKCTDLEELITLGKGTVVMDTRRATVCIGEASQYENTICVDVTWVLDSIQYNICKNFEKYILQLK